jgi:hypothetical protein
MSKKRSLEKWNNQFLIVQKTFESISELYEIGGEKLVTEACVAYRNPVVFDNQVSDAVFELPFCIPGYGGEKMTHDHLIGMSNIVLYIHKRGINKTWNSSNDFIQTLKALQVLLLMPKSLNDKGSFKDWQFDYSNIEDCIYWNKKLKREGITTLTAENGQFEASVDDVWSEWYNQFKNSL